MAGVTAGVKSTDLSPITYRDGSELENLHTKGDTWLLQVGDENDRDDSHTWNNGNRKALARLEATALLALCLLCVW